MLPINFKYAYFNCLIIASFRNVLKSFEMPFQSIVTTFHIYLILFFILGLFILHCFLETTFAKQFVETTFANHFCKFLVPVNARDVSPIIYNVFGHRQASAERETS